MYACRIKDFHICYCAFDFGRCYAATNGKSVTKPFVLYIHGFKTFGVIICYHSIYIAAILFHYPALFGVAAIKLKLVVITYCYAPVCCKVTSCGVSTKSFVHSSMIVCSFTRTCSLVILIYGVLHRVWRFACTAGRGVIFSLPRPIKNSSDTVTLQRKAYRRSNEFVVEAVGHAALVPFLDGVMFQIRVHYLDVVVGRHGCRLAVTRGNSG